MQLRRPGLVICCAFIRVSSYPTLIIIMSDPEIALMCKGYVRMNEGDRIYIIETYISYWQGGLPLGVIFYAGCAVCKK